MSKKVYTKSGDHFICRVIGGYDKSAAAIDNLVAEAMQDLPSLSREQIRIHVYGGAIMKYMVYIEFATEKKPPEGYEKSEWHFTEKDIV